MQNITYGSFGNKHAPMGDDDIAASITLTCQAMIKQSNKALIEKLSLLSGKSVDDLATSLIMNDTDSLVYNTLIDTDRGNIAIGELWTQYDDKLLISEHGHELKATRDLHVRSINDDNTYSMKPVRRIIRHKVSKEKFKITVNGKSITMTGDHGCIVYGDGKRIRISAKDIKSGDKMLMYVGGHNTDRAIDNLYEVEAVEQLEDFDEEYVYDLQMEDQTLPLFFANDILVHNSSYISITEALKGQGLKLLDENGEIPKEVHDMIQDIEDHLNADMAKWAKTALNSNDDRFVFKREAISDKGCFLDRKKRYVLHVLDDEGVRVDKYKYTGVQVVRTTMPEAIKPYVKRIVELMIQTQSQSQANDLLLETYDIFMGLDVDQLCMVSGISDLEKYVINCDGFNPAKKMPAHCKAAHFHNLIINDLGIEQKYEKIGSGDKVRYVYCKPQNRYGINIIGWQGDMPEEFADIVEFDYQTMFEKVVYKAIEGFYESVNWKLKKPNESLAVDLDDYFS